MSGVTPVSSEQGCRDPYDVAQQGLRPSCEFDWYAVDDAGHVAMFSSAGFGPIPKPVFHDRAAYESVHEFFSARQPSTRARLVRQLPPSPSLWQRVVNLVRFDYGERRPQRLCLDDWLQMAARGVFAYDFDLTFEVGACYRVVAVPELPLSLEDLPEAIRQWLVRLRFPGSFGNTEQDPRVVFDCV